MYNFRGFVAHIKHSQRRMPPLWPSAFDGKVRNDAVLHAEITMLTHYTVQRCYN